jgi:hypothetical protein
MSLPASFHRYPNAPPLPKILPELRLHPHISAGLYRSALLFYRANNRNPLQAGEGLLMELVGVNTDISLIGIDIDKTRVDTTKGDRLVKPEVRSLELILERYNLFLRNQKDKAGIVILDPTKEKSDDNLRYFQSFLLSKSRNLRPLHIVEGTFFAKSHTSNLLQISDVCANVFYREMTRKGGTPEFKSIYPRFWRHGTRIKGFGVKTWP